jgi:hypothetical protein
VIHECDRALRTVVSTAAGAPEGLTIDFDPPTREWADKMSPPRINLCLYDVREDKTQRRVGQTPMRNERNQIIGWRPPPKIYRLSYIGTAWAGDTEADHELLGWFLGIFAGMSRLPETALTGSLARAGLAALEVCQPAADARPTPQSLTALSGAVRPTLDIVVIAPIYFETTEAAGLVLEELILDAHARRGLPDERVQRRMDRRGIAELERSPAGHPLVERSRAGDPEDAQPMREDDPENQ